ncbi:MAG: hypothetical protein WBM13_14700 [Bacteroidia bacterium]
MKLYIIAFLGLFLYSCTPIPKTKNFESKKIAVGPGPEDIVLDTFSSSTPRLFASCSQRRKGQPEYQEICEINLTNDSYKIIKRTNEPKGMVFRPHGIDLVKNKSGEVLLYCVSHNEEKKEHSIIVYKVYTNYLEFKEKLDSPLLVSPNDVTANCNGDIFVTNDAGKRGSTTEQLFKLKRANVIKYSLNNKSWTIIANKVCYANGIAVNKCPEKNILFSTVRSNKLYVLENEKVNQENYPKKTIAKLKGLDNITFINDKEILVTAHLRQIAFLKHYKDANNKAPTVVYKVNLETGESTAVYTNDGSAICGASTALIYNGKMYLSQIFEPFILKVDL